MIFIDLVTKYVIFIIIFILHPNLLIFTNFKFMLCANAPSSCKLVFQDLKVRDRPETKILSGHGMKLTILLFNKPIRDYKICHFTIQIPC